MIGALRRGFCKVVSGGTDGLYTVTEEIYDATAKDTEAATANGRVVESNAYEISGNEDLSADDGPYAFSEVIGKEGTPIILFSAGEVDQPGDGYALAPRNVGFSAHYAGTNETTSAFVEIPNCLRSIVQCLIELRICEGNGGAAETYHPEDRSPWYTGISAYGSFGNIWNTYDGGLWGHPVTGDEWRDVRYHYISNCSTSAMSGITIQCKCDTSGNLSLRVVNANLTDGDTYNAFTMIGILRIIPFNVPCSATVETIEFGNGSDHEPGGTWGDGLWTPTS